MAVGLLFPGQGSQFVGMVDAWASHPASQAVLAEANEAFGQDLAEMARDEKALARTDVVQPVTLACELAAFRVLSESAPSLDVAAAAGHSLGEFAALAAAGVIPVAGAFEAVRIRSRAMQAASDSGQGAMTALIGLSIEDAKAICDAVRQDDVLLVANENSPVQTVLSGSTDAIDRAEELARERKARAIRLPLPGAFHSPLMEPARAEVEQAINKLDFAAPRFPIIPNATGAPTSDPDELRAALLRHLVSPVHWVSTMAEMQRLGVDTVIEVGPGNVLTKLAKRCAPDVAAVTASTPEEAQVAGGGA